MFRLFPGVVLITKVATKPQPILTINIHNKPSTHILLTSTHMYLSAPGVHYHSKYWPEPYKLDPSRWITYTNKGSGANAAETGAKKTVAADKTRHMCGTLLTFSDGSRACLGRKFAQAEYIAFLAALLKDFRVCLAPETDRQVVERDMYLKCAGKVTLAPLDNVKIELVRRKRV